MRFVRGHGGRLIDAHAPLRVAFRPVNLRSPAELRLSADGRHLEIGPSQLALHAAR